MTEEGKARRKYDGKRALDEFDVYRPPDLVVEIPKEVKTNDWENHLEVWYDHARKRTYVKETMLQTVTWCEGIITPEEALADHLAKWNLYGHLHKLLDELITN